MKAKKIHLGTTRFVQGEKVMSDPKKEGADRAPTRDINLARAVLTLMEAAEDAKDLIYEAAMYGWGKDEDDDPWPKDRVNDAHLAVRNALLGVQKALKEGDYWADDDDGLRSE
jgi:hypothetical protein